MKFKILIFLIIALFIGYYSYNKTKGCDVFLGLGESQIEVNGNIVKYNSCKVNEYLEKPNNSKYDFVSNIDFSKLSYSEFPFIECIHSAYSNEQIEACKNLSQKEKDTYRYPAAKIEHDNGYYYVEFIPELILRTIEDTRGNYTSKFVLNKNINQDTDKSKREFVIRGYSDVNEDGFLDMIIVVTDLGSWTLLAQSTIVLTKFSENGRLKVIETDNI